jgi:hypothetical protein
MPTSTTYYSPTKELPIASDDSPTALTGPACVNGVWVDERTPAAHPPPPPLCVSHSIAKLSTFPNQRQQQGRKRITLSTRPSRPPLPLAAVPSGPSSKRRYKPVRGFRRDDKVESYLPDTPVETNAPAVLVDAGKGAEPPMLAVAAS